MSLSPDSIQEAREHGLEVPYYQPKYFNHYNENPVDGKNIFRISLERDTILQMITANGVRWVLQEKGMKFRATKNWDGTYHIISRDTCGNKVYQFYTPKKKTELSDNYQQYSQEYKTLGKRDTIVYIVKYEGREVIEQQENSTGQNSSYSGWENFDNLFPRMKQNYYWYDPVGYGWQRMGYGGVGYSYQQCQPQQPQVIYIGNSEPRDNYMRERRAKGGPPIVITGGNGLGVRTGGTNPGVRTGGSYSNPPEIRSRVGNVMVRNYYPINNNSSSSARASYTPRHRG